MIKIAIDLLDHWQTLIAGLLALLAAFITVLVTLRLERRKADREVDALRKSLAIELRLQIARAFSVYDGLRELSSPSDGPISVRMRMPAPIVYSANAGKIELLNGDAADVVMVYTLLEGARDQVDRLNARAAAAAARGWTKYKTPDDIYPDEVLKTAEAFLEACKYARAVLPKFQTGVASYDALDETLIQQINAALAARRA